MCGRYRLSRKDRFAEYFEVNPFDDFEPRYKIAGTLVSKIAAST